MLGRVTAERPGYSSGLMPRRLSHQKVWCRPSKLTAPSTSVTKAAALGVSGGVARICAPGGPAKSCSRPRRGHPPERGDPRDEAEEDGERLAAAEPGRTLENGEDEDDEPVDRDGAGEHGGVVGGERDDLEPGEGEVAGDRRPVAEAGEADAALRPRRRRVRTTGPLQGSMPRQRSPRSMEARASPTQTTVQTVRVSRLPRGSRVPKKPIATRTARTRKPHQLPRLPGGVGKLASRRGRTVGRRGARTTRRAVSATTAAAPRM